jgi:hypothetical protein
MAVLQLETQQRGMEKVPSRVQALAGDLNLAKEEIANLKDIITQLEAEINVKDEVIALPSSMA